MIMYDLFVWSIGYFSYYFERGLAARWNDKMKKEIVARQRQYTNNWIDAAAWYVIETLNITLIHMIQWWNRITYNFNQSRLIISLYVNMMKLDVESYKYSKSLLKRIQMIE